MGFSVAGGSPSLCGSTIVSVYIGVHSYSHSWWVLLYSVVTRKLSDVKGKG